LVPHIQEVPRRHGPCLALLLTLSELTVHDVLTSLLGLKGFRSAVATTCPRKGHHNQLIPRVEIQRYFQDKVGCIDDI